jgi:hypothetical protein
VADTTGLPSVESTRDSIERWRVAVTASHLIGAGLDISYPAPANGPICKCCGRPQLNIRERRLNTAYYNEDQNWLTSCKDCFDEVVAYYKERWDDYYAR